MKFGQIVHTTRNTGTAHPQFTVESLQPAADASPHIEANLETFQAADRDVKIITAGLYPVFEKYYPQLVAHALTFLDAHAVDNHVEISTRPRSADGSRHTRSWGEVSAPISK